MEIKNFKSKGLKALYQAEKGAAVKGVPAELTKKLRDQLTLLQSASNIHQIASMGMWKVHELKPKQPGKWSMWVTGNYRLTFWVDSETNAIRTLIWKIIIRSMHGAALDLKSRSSCGLKGFQAAVGAEAL